jgi:hypothetical protein
MAIFMVSGQVAPYPPRIRNSKTGSDPGLKLPGDSMSLSPGRRATAAGQGFSTCWADTMPTAFSSATTNRMPIPG